VTAVPLELRYCSQNEFTSLRAEAGGRLLGAVAYGAVHPPGADVTRVDVDVLGERRSPVIEAWLAAGSVQRAVDADVRLAWNDHVLYGALQTTLDGDMSAAAERAYRSIFSVIRARGYSHLLRVWNYFPGINADDAGLERYRRFSLGRHAAFSDGQAADAAVPSASALGVRDGPLTIYFIAARTPGLAVENPRQISAYHYPGRYGPKSPLFSRAMQSPAALGPLLFVSGTASIVGHETRHAGDVRAQCRELLDNIRTVVARAAGGRDTARRWQLKVYVRHRSDLGAIDAALRAAFPDTDPLYLRADICRADLLVEVEAVCTPLPAETLRA